MFLILIIPRMFCKILHSLLMLGAIVCSAVGLSAVWKSLNDNQQPNLSSLHSWIGIMALILLAQNYLLGTLHFFLGLFPISWTSTYLCFHKLLGTFTFIAGVVAVATGLQYMTYGCNNYVINGKDNNPAEYYGELLNGCKLAYGAGVSIFLGLLFILLSIRPTISVIKAKLDLSEIL